MKTPLLIASLLLLIAIAPMPYGYYQFLRIAVTIVAGMTAFSIFETNKNLSLYVFVAITILYNPIFTIHFDKATWIPINIITTLVFVVFALFSKKGKPI